MPVRSVQPSPWEPQRQPEEPAAQQIIRGHCWVIDGDTIVINKIHIRLAGIDAPETDHPYGQNAKRALMNLRCGQVVTAVMDGSTSHDRTIVARTYTGEPKTFTQNRSLTLYLSEPTPST